MASKAIISCDPGVNGALSLMMDGNVVEYTVMPPSTTEVANWLDKAVAQATAEGMKAILVVEYQQPRAGENIRAVANMMRRYGQWEVHALYLGLPYHEVTPAVWKRNMQVTRDKGTSIELCQRLFPSVNLVLPRCRKPHDGIAEAVLIGEYARRKDL